MRAVIAEFNCGNSCVLFSDQSNKAEGPGVHRRGVSRRLPLFVYLDEVIFIEKCIEIYSNFRPITAIVDLNRGL